MNTAQSLMKKNIVKVAPQDSILEAYRRMHMKNIRHLPVFEDNTLVGMLSDRDIQRAMVVNKTDELNLEIFLSEGRKVEEYMSWPIFTVMDAQPLGFIIEEMINRKISAVLVQNNSFEYVGIITTEDIMFEFLRILNKEEDLKDRPLSYFMSNTLY